jgi:hypothetical protein
MKARLLARRRGAGALSGGLLCGVAPGEKTLHGAADDLPALSDREIMDTAVIPSPQT